VKNDLNNLRLGRHPLDVCCSPSSKIEPSTTNKIRKWRVIWVLWFCFVFDLFEDLACSHRLRGLPSSAGSPSLLHLRALAPQRRAVSFWQGTVEPQPPPHACSVVAWPIARQGFYGGQPTRYPDPRLSPGRSHSPHPSVTGSYDDRLM